LLINTCTENMTQPTIFKYVKNECYLINFDVWLASAEGKAYLNCHNCHLMAMICEMFIKTEGIINTLFSLYHLAINYCSDEKNPPEMWNLKKYVLYEDSFVRESLLVYTFVCQGLTCHNIKPSSM